MIKKRVLVVDDREFDRDALSRHLTRRGYQVSCAASGAAALEIIDSERLDVVLLDVLMPGMDGGAVLEQIRERRTASELPVIMVTAKTGSEDIVEFLSAGANDYVTKPIDVPVLLARLETQIGLRRLAEIKDEFLAMASHDLKSPLTALLAASQVMAKIVPPGKPMTQEASDFLQGITDTARTMKRIIEDFLDFEVLRNGQMRLAPTAVDLNAVVRRTVDDNSGAATKKRIALETDLAETALVEADEVRIAQVIDNLVNNAVKYSPRDTTVTVRTRAVAGSIEVSIEDRGPGVPENEMERLFVKFSRLSNLPTGGETSNGLGLSICRQLVLLHDGAISARNNPEGGATFSFTLPTERPAAVAAHT